MSANTEFLFDVFFMFANTRLHVTSHHDVVLTLIAIHCDSLCTNCRFEKKGLVDHIGVLQTPIKLGFSEILFEQANVANLPNLSNWP